MLIMNDVYLWISIFNKFEYQSCSWLILCVKKGSVNSMWLYIPAVNVNTAGWGQDDILF